MGEPNIDLYAQMRARALIIERPSLTFSYTFDDAAPDDPDVLPAADDCRVGVP